MSITRPRLAFEDHFTQAPNRWVRDGRLSLKARGLLVQLLSHREGWRVSVASLAAVNPEGKDAIRAALLELSRHGYLVRSDEQPHSEDGTFSSYDYELADPWADQPQAENPPTVSPAETPHNPRSAPLAGFPTSDNPTPKKTIPSEDQRTPSPHSPPEGGEQAELLAAPEAPAVEGYPDSFEDVWAAWPKRRRDTAGKKAAHAAWRRAVVGSTKRKPRTTAGAILDAVKAYAADPNLPPEQYMPNLTTWINGDRWENGPLPARGGGGGRPAAGDTHRAMERSLTASERYRQLEENGYQPPQQQQAPQIEGRTA